MTFETQPGTPSPVKSVSLNDAVFDEQVEREIKMLAELLLDIYEDKLRGRKQQGDALTQADLPVRLKKGRPTISTHQ